MPQLITRDEALSRIRAEGQSPPCLMCAVRDRQVGATHAVYEDDEWEALRLEYARAWAQGFGVTTSAAPAAS